MEFSVTSVVENLFVQRVRLGREGGVVGSTLLDDSSKRARGTRSTTDVPRLTADRRRTKTLNRGRWRVVALEWGGEGGGEGTIGRLTWRYGVGDARGTPWTLGTDGNTPGGNIYRVSRFDARGETEEVFFAIFFFLFFTEEL